MPQLAKHNARLSKGQLAVHTREQRTGRKVRVIIVDDLNISRLEPVIRDIVGADERVQVSTLPGETVRPGFDKTKLQLWDANEDRNLVVIAGRLNDVLNTRAGVMVSELRQVSEDVQIAISTVPEVVKREFNIKRAVVEANPEIWKLCKTLGFSVIDINREVHHAGREVDFVQDGIHFSIKLS